VQVVVVYSPGYPSARVDDVPIAILGAAESTAQKKKKEEAVRAQWPFSHSILNGAEKFWHGLRRGSAVSVGGSFINTVT